MSALKTALTPGQRADAIVKFLAERGDSLAAGDSEWVSAGGVAVALAADVERTTIFRDLRKLVADGVVQAAGPTRSRVYRLHRKSSEFFKWELSQPPESRHRVAYDPEILKTYRPGKTRWLTKMQRDALHKLAQPRLRADEAAYRRVMNSLLIDLAYASSRLEDVRISWLDTKALIELGERPQGLTDKEFRIVMNHKEAIGFICDNRMDLDLSRRNILDVHKLLSARLLGNPQDEGHIRRSLVYSTESAYRPLDNPFVLEEQLNLFCDKANAIHDPFERSFFTMAMLPYLQPFQDANKRTSRLCMNIPLLRESLAPFSFSQIDRRAYVFGLLALYERGRPDFLAQVFFDTYVRSAPKYTELLEVVHAGGSINTLSAEPQVYAALVKRRRAK